MSNKVTRHKIQPSMMVFLATGVLAGCGGGGGGGDNSSAPTPIQCTTAQYSDGGICRPKANQTISEFTLPTLVVGNKVLLSATASSNLDVSYVSRTTDICTVDGSELTALAKGTCTVVASQAGNATTLSANPITAIGLVTPACATPEYLDNTKNSCVAKTAQTITNFTLPPMSVGDKILLAATTTSNLDVSYTSQTTDICTVSGRQLTAVAKGTCTVIANQIGSTTVLAANAVTVSGLIAPLCIAPQVLNSITNVCTSPMQISGNNSDQTGTVGNVIKLSLSGVWEGVKKIYWVVQRMFAGFAATYVQDTEEPLDFVGLDVGEYTITAQGVDDDFQFIGPNAQTTITLACAEGLIIDANGKCNKPPTNLLTKTGVTSCRDENKSGYLPCVPEALAGFYGVGQDGEIQAGAETDYRYVRRNGSECWEDGVTGLIWEEKNHSDLRGMGHVYTWYDSKQATNGGFAGAEDFASDSSISGYVDNLACYYTLAKCNTEAYIAALNAANYCGYSDWRLPTRTELLTLLDYSRINPSVTPDFAQFTSPGGYWTSSTSAADNTSAWSVGFFNGGDYLLSKKSSTAAVRAVRYGQ